MMDIEKEYQVKKKRRLVTCVGCEDAIKDQYVLHVPPDLHWHVTCLSCTDCGQQLDERCTCFVRNGKTYCKADYFRLFAIKCYRCKAGFRTSDLVMRAKQQIYHVECFRCVVCQRQLIPGDEYSLTDDQLYCRQDHDVIDSFPSIVSGCGVGDGSLSVPSSSSLPCSPTATADCFGDNLLMSLSINNNIINQANMSNMMFSSDETRSPLHNSSSNSSSIAGNDRDKQRSQGSHTGGNAPGIHGSSSSRLHKTDQKTTRVRTVLNEKQLYTLRTCYAANARPDALMKDQLVEMTGLSSRVIRVWFQNKRCKDKKRTILIKQIQQHHQDKMKGVPMIASSPIRHDPSINVQPSPVEIQQYVHPSALPPRSCCNWIDYASISSSSSTAAVESSTPHPCEPSSHHLQHHQPPPIQQLLNSFGSPSDNDNTITTVVDESKITHLPHHHQQQQQQQKPPPPQQQPQQQQQSQQQQLLRVAQSLDIVEASLNRMEPKFSPSKEFDQHSVIRFDTVDSACRNVFERPLTSGLLRPASRDGLSRDQMSRDHRLIFAGADNC